MRSRRTVNRYCGSDRCRKTTLHERLKVNVYKCLVCGSIKEPPQKDHNSSIVNGSP